MSNQFFIDRNILVNGLRNYLTDDTSSNIDLTQHIIDLINEHAPSTGPSSPPTLTINANGTITHDNGDGDVKVFNRGWTEVTDNGNGTVTFSYPSGTQTTITLDQVVSVNGLTGAVTLNTDHINEGSSNLYYTEARVSANSDVSANSTNRHSHANKAQLDLITSGGSGVVISAAERTKLSGIETAAELNTAANVGAGSQSYKTKVGSELRFRTLTEGSNITLTQSADEIEISATGAAGETNTMSNVGTGVGVYKQKTGVDFELRNIDAQNSKMTVNLVGDDIQVGLGSVNLNDLANVSASSPSTDDALMWTGSAWESQAPTNDWGSQVVVSDQTLSGDGTSGSPLEIAQQSATGGQVLYWNTGNTVWQPGPAVVIDPASSNYLTYDTATRTLSMSTLAVSDVTVDSTETSMANYVTANYTGGEHQSGDIIILTVPNEVWIHNGGSASTIADFTQIEVPSLSDSYIRNLFSSAGNPLTYNSTTGEFEVLVSSDANNRIGLGTDNGLYASSLATATSYDNTTSSLSATTVQAAIDEVEGRVDTLEGAGYITAANLSLGTITGTAIPLNIDSGTDVTLPLATTSLAGLLSAADKLKLDNVEAGAKDDQSAPEVPFTPTGDFDPGSTNVKLALDELMSEKADKVNVLELDNATVYTPTSNYHPATKLYVDNAVSGFGTGDMLKSVYDTGDNGIVDNSEKVNGVDTAGNLKYYGTNGSGTPGFYDIPSSSVTSVFSRTGVVVATAGDYDADQITNVPSGNLAATNLQDAVNELQLDIDTRIPLSQKGAASGVAPLNGSSKLDVSYLPDIDINDLADVDTTGVTNGYILEYSGGTWSAVANSGGTISNAYSSITDGTNTANSSASDTFKLRSSDSTVSITVTNDQVTHNDNADFTINQANINSASINNDAGFITGIVWGDITGTLSNQTDLQSALDAKAASSHVHPATDITYDNGVSGLTATNVKAAVDEIDGRVDTLEAASHSHSNKAVLDGIAAGDITNWDTAFGWGDHGAVGYLTGVGVKDGGSLTGTRSAINFIEGNAITLTVADDAGNNDVDVTIAVDESVIDNANIVNGAGYVTLSYFNSNLAGTTNTTPFTPTSDHHVATKKYVDDNAGGGGINDIASATDTDITTPSTGQILVYDGTDSWDNVSLSGGATMNSSGIVTLTNTSVTGQLLTGFSETNGTVASTDTILQAFNKLAGNQIDLQTISGLSQGAVSFGTFTGTTLSDNETAKNLFQELETAVEAAAGGGITAAYSSMTDGSTTSSASGSDTFEFTSANDRLSVAVTSNSPGDFLTLTVNEGNIVHDNLSGYVANEHINHGSVSITAGTGLDGGGDITASRTINISNTGVSANPYGSATEVATFTVNAQGQLTTAASTAIAIPKSQVTNFDEEVEALMASILTEGNGITIAHNDGLDQITLSVDLADINLEDLNDVTVTSIASDQYLRWNGSAWVNTTPSWTSSQISDFNESVQDLLGNSTWQDSADIDFTYDDGNNEFTAELTTTGVAASTYGSSTNSVQIAVDSKGRLTSASSVGINHNGLANYDSNEHIDHTAVSITAGTGLSGGGDISTSRTINLSHLGIQNLSDPNNDRIMFWDDSAGATQWLELGSGLSITGTTITATTGTPTLIEDADQDTSITVDQGSGDTDTIIFRTNLQERMRILSTGEVGVSRIPDAGFTFDVSGNTRVEDYTNGGGFASGQYTRFLINDGGSHTDNYGFYGHYHDSTIGANGRTYYVATKIDDSGITSNRTSAEIGYLNQDDLSEVVFRADGGSASTLVTKASGVVESGIVVGNSSIAFIGDTSGAVATFDTNDAGVTYKQFTIEGDTYFKAGIKDSNDTLGTSGQFLRTDGTLTHWTDFSSSSEFNEAVDDRVNATIIEGTGISKAYDDGANTLTLSVDPSAINLSQLGDTTIAAPSNGQVLTWNGSQWINQTVSATGNTFETITDGSNTATASGSDTLKFRTDTDTNYLAITVADNDVTHGDNVLIEFQPSNVSVGDLSDVDTTGQTDGHILVSSSGTYTSTVLNRWFTFTDGTTNIDPSGDNTFKFRSTSNAITADVIENDATHGDHLAITFNPGNVDIGTLNDDGTYATAAHSHSTGDITGLAEFIIDTMGDTALTDSSEITWAHNDGSDEITASLATTGVTATTYGSAASVGQFTVDTKGRITTASNVNIDHDSLTGFVSNEHVDHSSVTLIAGVGIASTGLGDLTANRTISIDPTNTATTVSIDGSTDFVMYSDTSDSGQLKKLTPQNLAGAINPEDLNGVTAVASELNLLDLSGLTTGHVLVATGATTAAWEQLDAVDVAFDNTGANFLTSTEVNDAIIDMENEVWNNALRNGGSGTNMGTFTGSILTDNSSVKTLLQDLETEVEKERLSIYVIDGATDVDTTGDGQGYILIPNGVTGNITHVGASFVTAGTGDNSGTTDIQIARVRSGSSVDVLSTKLTIDATETNSSTAATAAVINTSNDDVQEWDMLRVDIDAVSSVTTGDLPEGLLVYVVIS